MRHVICSIPTPNIIALGKKIGESAMYTNNLVSTWQTENNTVEIPTLEQLKEYRDKDQQQQKESRIQFATPVFQARPFISFTETPIIEVKDDGTILITDYRGQNPDFFYKSLNPKTAKELKEILGTGSDFKGWTYAYNFLLWREANLRTTPPPYKTDGYLKLYGDNPAIAKLKAWMGEKASNQPQVQQLSINQSSIYEVSTAGDKRFSAYNARFKPGTIVAGKDVGGMSIENAYQNLFKQSSKGAAPRSGSYLDVNSWLGAFESGNPVLSTSPELAALPPSLLNKMRDVAMGNSQFIKKDYEDFSYYMAYLPLWQEWARQNPTLMQDLAKKSAGKALHDKFATNTSVNQARALTEILGKSNNQNDNTNFISATIAPYYGVSYDEYLKMSKGEQNNMRTAFQQAATNIATALGLQLDLSAASFNVGGYSYDDGGSTIEPSFTFRFNNATPEKVRLFAALMGDLGFQSQESVVVNWDTDNLDEANGVRFTVKVKDVDTALEAVKQTGIKNFTVDKQQKTISVLSFDTDDVSKLQELYTNLKDNRDGEIIKQGFQSFFDNEEGRRNLYQEWLASQDGQSQQGQLSSFIQEAITNIDKGLTRQQRESRQLLGSYYTWQQQHIKKSPNFKKDHTYFVDDKKVDYSITQLREAIWPVNIPGDHAYATAIGNAVDAIVRDFFEGKHSETKSYPNMTEERRNSIIADCERLKKEIQRRWGKKARIITTEFTLAGKVTFNGKTVTVAGTMDMLVIDERGDLHILDMKAKHNSIEDYTNRRDYTFQLNAYRQLIEALMPEFKGRIKDMTLIWFMQSYPQQGVKATYITDEETDLVSVTDKEGAANMPLSDYKKWETPRLNPDDVSKSLIDLQYSDSLSEVQSIDSNWRSNINPVTTTPITAPAPISKQEVQQRQETQNMNALPKIGIENFSIDKSNERAKLVSTFSSQQRKFRVEQMARDFSDTLSTMIKEATQEANDAASEYMANGEVEKAREAIAEFNLYNADDAKSRRELITTKGVNAVLSRLLSKYQEMADTPIEDLREIYGERAEYIKGEYQKIVDNFMPLLQEVAIELEGKEPVRFIFINEEYNDGTGVKERPGGYIDNDPSDVDDDNDQNGDDPEGKRATGNDGWSYQAKFIEPHNTLTKEVKRVLRSIMRVDAEGNPMYDDLGNIRMVPERYAYASLLTECASISEVSDFIVKNGDGTYSFPLLEKMANVPQYAWVRQLIAELENDIRLASQFYRNFRKDAVSYWTERRDPDSGVIKLFPLNTITREDSSMAALVRNYNNKMPQHPDGIFDSNGNLSKENATKGLQLVNSLYADIYTLDSESIPGFIEKLTGVIKMLGFSDGTISIERIMELNEKGELGENGSTNLRKVLNAARSIFRAISTNKVNKGELPENLSYVNYFSTGTFRTNGLSTIAQLGGIVSENDHVQIFRIGDNDYPTYTAPDYSTTLFKKLGDDNKRQQYLDTHFKPDSWFFRNGHWNNTWLQQIEGDTAEARDIRAHMTLQDIPVLGDELYEEWTPNQIRSSFIRKYFSAGYNPKAKVQYGWYNFPIFSDSTMARFIRFVRYTGSDFKKQMTPLFRKVVLQELSRIKRVEDRREARVKNPNVATEIANYDKNGDKFFFFPELNDLIVETRTNEDGSITNVTFLDKCRELKKAKDNKALIKLIDDTVCGEDGIMDKGFQEFIANCEGVRTELTQDLAELGAIKEASELDAALEEYYWNHHFATSQIIQLTTTDLAYYKFDGGIDFQKRFKEVYAGGEKLNVFSEYGKETEKSLILSDQVITSTSYQDIRVSLNKAVKEGRLLPMDRDNILYKFRNVNVVDGQAFRSLRSMRSILDMMGIWTDDMQKAFDRFERGEWDMSDFNLVWQTIKPYLFTNTLKSDGIGGQQRVPIQHKDSEFLLLSIYQLVAAATGKNNKLRAINQFMDDKKIDVILFESAVKVGGQGAVDVSYSKKALDDWIEAHPSQYAQIRQAALDSRIAQEESKKGRKLTQKEMRDIMDKLDSSLYITIFKEGNDVLLDNDTITQEQYNERFEAIEPTYDEVYKELESQITKENVIHENSYEDYSIQQPTPEHLFDVYDAVFGSQFRNLIMADMPEDIEITVQGITLKGRKAVLDLYQSLITENLLDGFEQVQKSFGNIESLRDFLLEQVSGNPKYGRDLLDALELREIPNPLDPSKKIKVFNIPLYCPMITAKVQELILSKFKNAITKQKIHGGNAILASDFGFTKELHVLHDKNTGAVTGIECYLPAYSKDFYEPFLVEKTRKANDKEITYYELDIDKMPEELRRGIGYRIPTEDKYSMVPLIIKGFLPQQNGSSIMLPAEITTMSGSDFDVDKLFLMLPTFRVQRYNLKKAHQEFDRLYDEDTASKNLVSAIVGKEAMDKAELARTQVTKKRTNKTTGEVEEYIADVLDRKTPEYKQAFEDWFEDNKEKFLLDRPVVTKIKYRADKGPEGNRKNARDNMIIDIAFGILTHPSTAEKLQNPGSFDNVKAMARVSTIVNDPVMIIKFCEKYKVSPKNVGSEILSMAREKGWRELDDFVQKNSPIRSTLSLDTFIFNHQQNMAGAALIGMYANNTTAQAKNQLISMSISDNIGIMINGRRISSLTAAYNENNGVRSRISKNCAEFSAASVDNGKDPNLAALKQNIETANIMGTMLRAGLSIEEASLLFAHPTIREAIDKGYTNKYQFSENVVKKLINEYLILGGVKLDASIISTIDFTSEFLINAAVSATLPIAEDSEDNSEKAKRKLEELQIAILFNEFMNIADYMGDLTRNTRADSPNGAIDITMAGAEVQRRSVELMHRKAMQEDCPINGLDNTINNNVLSSTMSREQMREALKSRQQPMLQGFYSLGIDIASQIIGQHFTQTAPFMRRMLNFLHDNSQFGVMPKGYLNAFFNDAFKYYLATSTIFGTNYESRRDYYLNKFPQEFIKTIRENPDLANIGIVRKLMLDSKTGGIVFDKSSKLDRVTAETLMRDFDLLMYDSDNPNAQQLALDLFAYCFYRDGFTFGPNNFGRFFSSNFMMSLPAFINTARDMLTNKEPNDFWDNFMDQFYMYYGTKPGVCKKVKASRKHIVNADGTISIANVQVLNKNSEEPKSYDYIQYAEGFPFETITLYKKISEGPQRTIYQKVPTINIVNGKRYNPLESREAIIDRYQKEIKQWKDNEKERKGKNDEEILAAIRTSEGRQPQSNPIVSSNLPMVDSSALATIENLENSPRQADIPTSIINSVERELEGSTVPEIPADVIAQVDAGDALVQAQLRGVEDNTSSFLQNFNEDDKEIPDILCKK